MKETKQTHVSFVHKMINLVPSTEKIPVGDARDLAERIYEKFAKRFNAILLENNEHIVVFTPLAILFRAKKVNDNLATVYATDGAFNTDGYKASTLSLR